ncbi:MAG TPA: FAD:protein FMN transferase [Solirubrobacteraceae bacterium]|nr:FAD:protein FMN transferase [Solirubrobacteraceae bacterium]
MSLRSFAVRPEAAQQQEHRQTFPCFGGQCTVIVADARRPADAAAAAAMARRALETWHHRFSRFEDDSEVAALNRSAADEVAVSPLLRRMVQVAVAGARDTGGLVDFTLAREIEQAGYAHHLEPGGSDLRDALRRAPARSAAGPHPAARWREISVDAARGTVRRPPGLRIDVGGIAKGVFADELAGMLDGFDTYAVDCAGDIRVGGRARAPRPVRVSSPFDTGNLHTFSLAGGGIATSGIGRRSWTDDGGRPAHHLLDPRTGAPAFTGIVQATALAPSAAQAEILAKAAVLSGPGRAAEWLTHGGILVYDDGTHDVLAPPPPAATSTAGPLRVSWTRAA